MAQSKKGMSIKKALKITSRLQLRLPSRGFQFGKGPDDITQTDLTD